MGQWGQAYCIFFEENKFLINLFSGKESFKLIFIGEKSFKSTQSLQTLLAILNFTAILDFLNWQQNGSDAALVKENKLK
jgi:hypothetical protein